MQHFFILSLLNMTLKKGLKVGERLSNTNIKQRFLFFLLQQNISS